MKKKIFILLVVVISIITIGATKEEKKQAKNRKIYEAKTHFYFSNNGGRAYSDEIREFKVGDTVLMKVNIEIRKRENIFMKVANFLKPSLEFVNCKIIIPYVTPIDVKFTDRPNPEKSVIKVDEINGIMTCEAKIGVTTTKKEKKVKSTKENESGNYQEVDEKKIADAENYEWTIAARFIPNQKTDITIRIIFDDNIDEAWDKEVVIFAK